MRIEVVCAFPGGADVTLLELHDAAVVKDALTASRIAERHPNIDLSQVGIFGRRAAPDTRLAPGDRVEIYRPLALDAKEARRRRARRSRSP